MSSDEKDPALDELRGFADAVLTLSEEVARVARSHEELVERMRALSWSFGVPAPAPAAHVTVTRRIHMVLERRAEPLRTRDVYDDLSGEVPLDTVRSMLVQLSKYGKVVRVGPGLYQDANLPRDREHTKEEER